ncbi:MAG: hypothetical protein AAFQ94_21415 [Bacteroidota bacterium]
MNNLTVSGANLTINPGVTLTLTTGNLEINDDGAVVATGAIINIAGDFNEAYGRDAGSGGNNLNTMTGGIINLTTATSDFRTGGGSSFTMDGTTVNLSGGVISLNNEVQTINNSIFTGAASMDVNLSSMSLDNTSITTTGNLELQLATISNGSVISAGGILQIASGLTTFDDTMISAGTGNTSTTGQEALEFNGGGSIVLNNRSNMNVKGDLIDQRNMTIDNSDVTITGNMENDGGDVVIVRNNGTLTVQGNFTNNGGSSVESNGGSTISVEGDFTNSGGSGVDTDGGVVVVGGSYTGTPPTGDGSGCTGGGGACCGSSAACSTLPVSLLTFDAEIQNNAVVLTWKTAQEDQNDFFTIYRSSNGIDFQEIATVKGVGTTNQVSSYTYRDRSFFGRNLYYQLEQSDFDGTTEKLRIVYLENQDFENKISVYPTRLSLDEELHISYDYEEDVEIQLALINIDGKRTTDFETRVSDRGVDLNLTGKSLKPGMYILSGEIGGSTIRQRIILTQ